jgi:hypothetical protein
MISRRHTLVWVVRFMAVALGVVSGAGLCGMLYLSGPIIQAWLFPIITPTHVARSVKYTPEQNELCWGVHFIKHRNDAPAYFNYRVVFKASPDPEHPEFKPGISRVPLAVYRIRPDGSKVFLSTYGFAHHMQEDEWTSEYCADLPNGLELNAPFKVEGEGFYDTWHHLWLVPQDLPDFEVPGVEKLTRDGALRVPLSVYQAMVN